MPTRLGKDTLADEFINVCYSQLGEDQIVDHFFSNVLQITSGFYVDVGCHHPLKFSNTYGLYLKGWRGICIDADENLSELYKKHRPHDTFIGTGVGKNESESIYYIFENGAANTFDEDVKNEFLKKGWKLKDQLNLKINRLDNLILSNNITKIDYLNIDVEGLDMDVLDSFDFTKHQPSLISIETNCRDLSVISNSPITKKLLTYGYYPYSHCVITTFFALKF